MWSSTALAVSSASLLFLSADAAGLYPKNSAVLNVHAYNYRSLITLSNYTSIVEFYAPWCGHCQNLKPAYEKAAKRLQGVAKVAAVNCDDEENKALCGSLGIKGFPTLKIVRPGKKAGKPVVEDYQSQRTAQAIIEAVKQRIPMHVKKVTDKNIEAWVDEKKEAPKVILFSDKTTTADFFKALAIDFLGSVSFAQMKDSTTAAKETYGITKSPTIILLPGGDKEKIVYDGELTKEGISSFLSQVASPNPDPAPEPPKAKKDKKEEKKKPADKKAKSASSEFSKASADHKASDASKIEIADSDFTVESFGQPTESPSPQVEFEKPTILNDEPLIKQLNGERELDQACFGPKSQTCVLALLPASMDKGATVPEDAQEALASLGGVRMKYSSRQTLFPFYAVPAANTKSKAVREALGLKSDDSLQLIAVNAKRSWWRQYSGDSYGIKALDDWVDAIRMSEGKREKLPEKLIVDPAAVAAEPATSETEATKEAEPATEAPAVEEATPAADATADRVAEQSATAEPEPAATPEVDGEVPEPAATATDRDEL